MTSFVQSQLLACIDASAAAWVTITLPLVPLGACAHHELVPIIRPLSVHVGARPAGGAATLSQSPSSSAVRLGASLQKATSKPWMAPCVLCGLVCESRAVSPFSPRDGCYQGWRCSVVTRKTFPSSGIIPVWVGEREGRVESMSDTPYVCRAAFKPITHNPSPVSALSLTMRCLLIFSPSSLPRRVLPSGGRL